MALSIAIAAAGLSAAKADILFYGGDFDGFNGLPSERDLRADARVYDDFDLSDQSAITGIFGNFLETHESVPKMAYFEIRSAIEPGNGGTLLASGDIPVESRFLGFFGQLRVWQFSGEIAPVSLEPGDYWVALAPISNLNGLSSLLTTSGANGVGHPLQNGNTFFDGTVTGSLLLDYNFVPVENVLGSGPLDFSIGVAGHAVPEPSATLILCFGIVVAWLRAKKVRQFFVASKEDR